ncbi:MAG: molybdopterin-dependent oxidoreductase [bacterium]|nr:molybdopterin-dependent oxidoreductase [bacterium]
MTSNNTVSIRIDNHPFTVEKGLTILKAAEQNNIYIPTLCAHKELTPYGGCRMCLVEVEGARRFLTACTTPVEDGMVIRTHTDQIQKERREIMELILSEHTSSCLICEESELCRQYMPTIRKAGVTTGCRYCPNDDKCELEKVVSWLEIKDINHPVYYRGLSVEKYDPFYDRDYNLCIYCGRCVRVCQEVRLANVLAFTQRGRSTVIGPAFGRSHLESGCEFCGACVSVCPTGALAEKSNKWNGVAEAEIQTTCALCGVGCQLQVLIRNDKAVATIPVDDEFVNHGQLCVKGRFCVNELVNHHQRITKASKYQDGNQLQIPIEDAIAIAAEQLKNCPPEDFAMVISPNCSNEDLFIAQKFVRTVMNSHHIDSSARLFYGNGFNDYLDLMKRTTALSEIGQSDVILCLGLDMRFGRSVVGVQIRKAIARGAKIITIHPNDHSLALNAELWIRPHTTEILDSISQLSNALLEKHEPITGRLAQAADLLNGAKNPLILMGGEFLPYSNSAEIMQQTLRIAETIGSAIVPLPAQNNLCGSLLMGAYPELLPGGILSAEPDNRKKISAIWGMTIQDFTTDWNLNKIFTGKKFKVVYLVGELPPIDEPIGDFVIYQNIYPPEHGALPNLILPAAAFTEIDGTFINGAGRVQRVQRTAPPPGDAQPDWQLLCQIARKMGATGFDYKNHQQIQQEIARFIERFKKFDRKPVVLPKHIKLQLEPERSSQLSETDRQSFFMLTIFNSEHQYRGIPIADKAEGFKKLIAEDSLLINGSDAHKIGVVDGDQVLVSSDLFEKSFPVRLSDNLQSGSVQIIQQRFQPFNPNPHPVKIRRKDV